MLVLEGWDGLQSEKSGNPSEELKRKLDRVWRGTR